MRAHLSDIDFAAAAAEEARTRHDVMAHVRVFGDAAPAARGIIHWGATSAYVTDNADLIQMREALALDRAAARRRSCASLRDFALAHRDLPALAYTHFQPAQPTTVGKRAALWASDLLIDLEQVRAVRRGPALPRRQGRDRHAGLVPAALRRRFRRRSRSSTPRSRRPRRVRAPADGLGPDLLAQAGRPRRPRALRASRSPRTRSATDLRLLQHEGELEEPFESSQVGSSAMPYKRNPMRAERVCSLARHVIALSLDTAMTAATQWLERTLDDSANKRIAVPEAFLATDAILILLENVFGGLVVHPEVSRRRLEAEIPFLATENVMMEAVRRGGDRQELHEKPPRPRARLGRRARSRRARRPTCFDRLAADSALRPDAARSSRRALAAGDARRPQRRPGRGLRPRGARPGARRAPPPPQSAPVRV